MEIKVETTQEMIEIVSGLVREGVNFSAEKNNNTWTITLTGGY